MRKAQVFWTTWASLPITSLKRNDIMSKPDPNTLAYMREMLDYHDVGNGALIWRYGRLRGELAGTETKKDKPELRIRFDGTSYLAAKVAWFLSMGYWTENRLKFLNGDRTDIRMDNLEETDRVDGPGR
jgi:hypothetical protein